MEGQRMLILSNMGNELTFAKKKRGLTKILFQTTQRSERLPLRWGSGEHDTLHEDELEYDDDAYHDDRHETETDYQGLEDTCDSFNIEEYDECHMNYANESSAYEQRFLLPDCCSSRHISALHVQRAWRTEEQR